MSVSAARKPLFAGIELLEVDLEQALAPERARLRPTVADRRPTVRRVRSAMEVARAHEERCRTTLVAADRLHGLLQCRYRERVEKRNPPCWVGHGPLVEELTTLVFARWHAFESPHASVGGAQYWHSYTLPSFYDRVRGWLGDELLACQQGRHRDHDDASSPIDLDWLARALTVSDLDVAIRVADPEEDATPVAKGPHGIEIPFLDPLMTERTAPTASRAVASLRSRGPRDIDSVS
jgi:hypothetical protein